MMFRALWSTVVALLVIVQCFSVCQAARDCMAVKEISTIAYNPDTRIYRLAQRHGSINVRGRQRQRQRRLDYENDVPTNGIELSIGNDERWLQQSNATTSNPNSPSPSSSEYFYYMRRCPCERDGRVLYCPLDAPLCFVPRRNTTTGWCEGSSQTVRVLRNIWPMSWIWCLLVAVGMVTSPYGRHGINFVVSSFLPCCWNRYLVRRTIANNPNFANRLIRMYHRRNRTRGLALPTVLPLNFDISRLTTRTRLNNENGDEEREEIGGKPTSLALRTRIYNKEEEETKEKKLNGKIDSFDKNDDNHDDNDNNNNNDDEDEEEEDERTCTICFLPLEDGDRVGDLGCPHIFHVDCLKTWLARRNCCPLCQQTNVATPRYDEITGHSGISTSAASTSSESEHAEDASAAANSQSPSE